MSNSTLPPQKRHKSREYVVGICETGSSHSTHNLYSKIELPSPSLGDRSYDNSLRCNYANVRQSSEGGHEVIIDPSMYSVLLKLGNESNGGIFTQAHSSGIGVTKLHNIFPCNGKINNEDYNKLDIILVKLSGANVGDPLPKYIFDFLGLPGHFQKGDFIPPINLTESEGI